MNNDWIFLDQISLKIYWKKGLIYFNNFIQDIHSFFSQGQLKIWTEHSPPISFYEIAT